MGASCEDQAAGSMHRFFSVIIAQNYQSGIMAHLSRSSYRKSGSGGGADENTGFGDLSYSCKHSETRKISSEKANVNSEVVFYENRLNLQRTFRTNSPAVCHVPNVGADMPVSNTAFARSQQ